ncbi:MAG TPA: LPS assembly protein LptD [Caulobacteraceae bacterium]|nr:LPS assembly protein LptD [Caulobacteraceae bacterium]
MSALALALALAPTLAHAEWALPPLTPPQPAKPAPPPPDDGLADNGFYLEADQLVDDESHNTVIAKGSVEARYQGRVLRAREVDYDRTTGIVTATGDVTIINADGTVEYADSIELDRQMSAGVAAAFSSRLQQNVTIAAAHVIRRSATLTELRKVLFTPCEVCAKKPSPTWSIRASRVIEDKKKQSIYFENAILQVHGLPVFYFPVLEGPDPSAKRKSGFLIPTVGTSSTRGFSWQQPYLQIISPSADLVVSPQINAKVNPFLNVTWRERFYTGAIEVRVGYTYEQNFDSNGDKLGDLTSRSYILAKGDFRLDDDWIWGFTAERASDPLIFDKYAVTEPFIDRGLYSADDRRLISQIYAVRQDSDSYFSAAAISVQGLREGDINDTFPTIGPLLEGHFDPDEPIFGGRLQIDGSGVVLTRDESPTDLSLPGIDSRRGTLEADWQRSFIFSDGIRLDPFVSARGDLYSISNLQPPDASNATIARGIATAGVNFDWPFIKQAGPYTIILEPLAQLAISPVVHQEPRIPDEDSVDFEFDTTNLFQVDKSPGFDILDSGQRLNVGARATVETDDGLSASALVGREFRAEPDPDMPARTGLEGTASDWVIGTDAIPFKNVDIFTRWRLDADTFAIRRLEIGADFTESRFNASIRYLEEAEDPDGLPVKDLDFRAELYVTKHWGLTTTAAREFTTGVWRELDYGVVYRDDCIKVEVVYHNDNTTNGVLGPSHSVEFRLTLATFGNSGYAQTSSTTAP